MNATRASGGSTAGWLLHVMQFCLGIAVVGGLGWLGLRFWPQPELPPGWQIIRPPQDVMALAVYQGELWSGGSDGLYRIDVQTGQVIARVSEPRNFRGVTSLVVDEADPRQPALWVGHNQGVSRFSAESWQHWGMADGLPDRQVLALCLTTGGELWAGTPHGAARLAPAGWQVVDRSLGLASDAVSVIFQDRHGRLWLGDGFTPQGGLSLVEHPPAGSQPVRTTVTAVQPAQLAHPVVNAILQDRNGDLWFGVGFSSQGGLTRFDGQTWQSWGLADGLAGAKTRSLYEDAAGALWIGSEYDGIVYYDLPLPPTPPLPPPEGGEGRPAVQALTPNQGLAGWEVKAMLQDAQGTFWLGTENGLSRLDEPAWLACCAWR